MQTIDINGSFPQEKDNTTFSGQMWEKFSARYNKPEPKELRRYADLQSAWNEWVDAWVFGMEEQRLATDIPFSDAQIPPGVTRQDVCIWTQDSDGLWNTSCSKKWEIIEGGPTDNEMHFCHHCGGSLLSEPFSEDFETDETHG